MNLDYMVQLYRLSGRPEISGSSFHGKCSYPEAITIIKELHKGDNPYRFKEIIIDGEDFSYDIDLPDKGVEVDFNFRIPTGSSETLHRSLDSFLKSDPFISKGDIPENFYLCHEDYYSKDANKPGFIISLENLCLLIKGLAKLAQYHDDKSGGGFYKLLFINPDGENGSKPIELETKVNSDLVSHCKNIDTNLLQDLSSEEAINDPNYTAKSAVFPNSLARFVGNRPSGSSFAYLVEHWSDFTAEYQKDLSTYISGFAFHKAKKEVAEAEFKIANELSKIISDMTGRLLSIPVSLAAILTIPKAGGVLERFVLLIGFCVASFIIYKTIDNQKRQFLRVKNAKKLVMSSIEGRKSAYPEDLRKSIDTMSVKLDDDEKALRTNLKIFSILSWTPAALALITFLLITLGAQSSDENRYFDIYASVNYEESKAKKDISQ